MTKACCEDAGAADAGSGGVGGGAGVDLEALLAREAGQFGRFQRQLLALAGLLAVAAGACGAEYVFTTARTRTRCLIPECEVASGTEFSPPWLAQAVPPGVGGALDLCRRYAPRARNVTGNATDSCPAALFDPAVVVNCEQYFYEDTNTVFHDLEVGCEEWLRSAIGSARVCGQLVGLPLTGALSDRWGRRAALVVGALSTAVLGSARYWAASYSAFIIGQFVETLFGGGTFTCIFILLQELVGPEYRVLAGTTANAAMSLGYVAAALLAWLLPHWRHLTLSIFLPHFLFLSYYWLVPESIRWYQTKEKFYKAEEAIKRVSKVNGKSLSEKTLSELKNLTEIQRKRSKDQNDGESWLIVEVFRHKPILLRCLIAPFWWITVTLVYYGLSINAVNMVGNRYVNYALVAAVEIPGFYAGMALMQRVGRRAVLAGGFWLCALCQLAYVVLPPNMFGVSLAIYLLGKSSISMVGNTMYVYTAELFPTRRRHSLFAFCSMLGRIGAILAPLTPALGAAMAEWVPFALFGALALAAGLLALLPPETRGVALPDTMCQAARLRPTPTAAGARTRADMPPAPSQ